MVFCLGTEQGLAAADACVSSRCFRVFVLAGKRRLGSFLPRDVELILTQFRSPFCIALSNFVGHTLDYYQAMEPSIRELGASPFALYYVI